MKNTLLFIGAILFLFSCRNENKVDKNLNINNNQNSTNCNELRDKIDEKNLEIEKLYIELNKYKQDFDNQLNIKKLTKDIKPKQTTHILHKKNTRDTISSKVKSDKMYIE